MSDSNFAAAEALSAENRKCPKGNGNGGDTESTRKAWADAWYEFSQNTTLHGFCKITEPQPFALRRVIWTVVVLGGIALFVSQVVSSVIYYRTWPVTVNVKINYNSTLQFPAVTICNQNDFRTTRAFEIGVYEMLHEFYSKQLIGESGDLSRFNRSTISLSDLYGETGHTQRDMIVGCLWDERPCSLERDFVTRLTDYGVCYTFNQVASNGPVKKVSRSGADRGLRLRINIEQYEYMMGPNPGAGIKLLVHEPGEVPLVRDLGVAIPPGTQAYVGVQTFLVNNLGHPYGRCNDSVRLDIFDEYSVPACISECRQEFLIARCRCREPHMPADPHGHPVCSLNETQNCLIPSMEEFFASSSQRCQNCPIPCRRLIYEPTITYAYSSRYDTDIFLRSNGSQSLRHKFAYAMDVVQKVTPEIVDDDASAARRFNVTLDRLTGRINGAIRVFESLLRSCRAEMADLLPRIQFHVMWGLKKVKHVLLYDFGRGFDLFKERTFEYLTPGYQETVSYIRLALARANATDNATKLMVLQSIKYDLDKRHIAASKAVDNLSSTYEAYSIGVPLLTFLTTYGRRYDMTYITNYSVNFHNMDKMIRYFNNARGSVNLFLNVTNNLIEINERVLKNGEPIPDDLDYWLDEFRRICRRYNYNLFMIESHIVQHPYEKIDAAIETFTLSAQNTQEAFERTQRNLISVIRSLNSIKNDLFDHHGVKHFYNLFDRYVSNDTGSKTELATQFTSREIDDIISNIDSSIDSATSQAQDLSVEFEAFGQELIELWKLLIEEPSLVNFRKAVYDDVEEAIRNETFLNQMINHFTEKCQLSQQDILFDPKLLFVHLNADAQTMEFPVKFAEINQETIRRRNQSRLIDILDETPRQLLSIMRTIRSNLGQFQSDREVNAEFFRNNFLTLDVFMKELSYEEIEQQIAYDITSLWSDIGGSMGLFIGASAITVIELFDVILHNMLKLHCCKKYN